MTYRRIVNRRYKALLQQALSRVPFGEQANYFFQRNVTHTYPRPESDFVSVASIARARVQTIQRHWRGQLEDATFYEFGAGWDLLGPLLFCGFGVNREIVVDLRPHVRMDLVDHTIGRLQQSATSLRLLRPPQHRVGPKAANGLSRLGEFYGIDYRAPFDARSTGLAPQSVDCITSTNTLEHIPPPDIAAILQECHRLLRDDGVASFRIDYQDHFSYFDPGISAYNFLRVLSRVSWT